MVKLRAAAWNKENEVLINSDNSQCKSYHSSGHSSSRTKLQERWSKLNPFQRSQNERILAERKGKSQCSSENFRTCSISTSDNEDSSTNSNERVRKSERQDDKSGSRRKEVEGSVVDQLRLAELNSKVLRIGTTSIANDRIHDKPSLVNASKYRRFQLCPHSPCDSPLTEHSENTPSTSKCKGLPAELSSSEHRGNLGSWLSRVAKVPRSSSAVLVKPSKSRKIRSGGSSRSKGPPNSLKLGLFLSSPARDRGQSHFGGHAKRGRIHAGRKGKHVLLLRRTKSVNSGLELTCAGLQRCRSGFDSSESRGYDLQKLNFLQESLKDSQLHLATLIERQNKTRDNFFIEVARLKAMCATLNRTQEVHYHSILDVFNENHRAFGYMESNFRYIRSLLPRARPGSMTDYLIELFRFLGDNTVASLCTVVRSAVGLYLRFFPRRKTMRS